MKKSELRKLYKEKRNNLSEVEITQFQENMYQQIYDLDISNVKNVHLFLSMRKFKEIDTKPLIGYFRSKNKRIVVSRCNFESTTLSHFYFDEDTKITLNKFGVPEPINAEEILETELDLIFVPMLISDENNYRVGYGKGYYDRFLSNCRKDAMIIGLNFFKPISKIEGLHEFDVALDNVIYPR
ncbi:5-formyltetrahydrofolate cyclo-ligase [Tenacibaculum todarodis]|uniref:5-formyltetrahydrofolate cyclo-ligase n=1 Tax=Tenacibaculum todarodis TaxID=1850252 RepID=A0A1L3JJU5_9FLAO|nr:5-formyltetrahydrofolate cyclo-ligase [Tenacibaculum todarodis]APG65379.1 5-formyltetrahydrofolate cyclo-ligase [Tenacibaculum todarodis]